MNVQGFDDDIVLFATTSSCLRELPVNMERLISDLELAFNAAKMKLVIRPRGSIYGNDLVLEYNGERIETADQYKYFGVNIQSDLSKKSDIQRVITNLNKSVGMFL